MRKLYFFDESERERILNLHESATKNQYLITEQETSTPAANIPGVTTTTAAAPDNIKIAMEKGYGPVSKEKADELASQGWPAKPASQQTTDWSKFPCVPKHPKAEKSATSGGQEIYFIPNGKGSKDTFYNNGTRIFAADGGKTGSYTCQDPIFKSGSEVQAYPEKSYKHAKHVTNVQNKLKEIDPAFAGGTTSTGQMDQATINKLMEILMLKKMPENKVETPTAEGPTPKT
jgi:hypothetical protein